MKNLLENIIRRRNPQFRFDAHVTMGMIFQLALQKGGQFVRGLLLRLKGLKGKGLVAGRGLKLFAASRISVGSWVKLGDYVELSALGKDGIRIGNNVGIGSFSRVIVSTSFNQIGAHIAIGNNVGIGEFAYLGGGGGLEIGDDCIIGQYLSCHPENHNFSDPALPIRYQGVTRKGIKIGKNCWIGSKVTILDGVTIGDGCVIAAGAVVNKSMPAGSVIGGVPAKVLRATHPFDANFKRA